MQESVAGAIAAQVRERIEDCELPEPDISGLKERIEEFASLGFAKAVEVFGLKLVPLHGKSHIKSTSLEICFSIHTRFWHSCR